MVRNMMTSSACGAASVKRGRSLRDRATASGASAIGLAFTALGPNPAFASDKLELIPDFAFFGLIADKPGLGSLWIMIIGFVALIFPLNQLIFQPIFRVLDARAERIQGARDRSTQLQREADNVLDQYETAIREARAESETTRQGQLVTAREEQASLTTEARREAESELERARASLSESLEEARANLRADAEDLATAAAERVLGRALS